MFFKNIFRDRDFGGQDVKVSLEISFMEAVQGCTKTVTFQTAVPCEACDGTGVPPGTRPETCKPCRGLGMLKLMSYHVLADIHAKWPLQIADNLFTMWGFWENREGVDDNETIIIHRSGGADPEGSQPGDLYVTIKVQEDPVFRREKADIHVDAGLNVTQAILGGTIQVPTLTGDVVLKVRPGTQPGQKVVLRGKGIKTRNSSYHGDQYVHFNVSIPVNLTQRQRMLIEEFAKEEQGEYDKGTAAAGASG
ncbi:putative Chaperone protein dnaJ GFA2, mitochondrial [Cocos nucifera]|nr:putative Chaperone protein dnaJ GFA2, mitochondrial [Cocos nucifera]